MNALNTCKPPHKGHVQVAFERRTGQTLIAWLLENGPTMTLTEAANAIGYAGHNPLKEYVARYLPEDFRFHKRQPPFTASEISETIARRLDGEPWTSIARSFGRDVLLLKDGCRRHINRAKRAEQ